MAARPRHAEHLERRQDARVRPRPGHGPKTAADSARLAREGLLGEGGDSRDDTGAAGRDVDVEAGKTSEAILGWYGRHIGVIPLLQPHEEIELGRRIAEARRLRAQVAPEAIAHTPGWRDTLERGARAKETLITANLRLVVTLAQQCRARSDPAFPDLVQEGTLGLMQAVEQFDPTHGYRFATYAVWWIRHRLRRAVADHGTMLRYPGYITTAVHRFNRAGRLLSRQAAGHAPTLHELADALGWALEKTTLIADLAHAVMVSLDTVVDEDQGAALGHGLASEAPGPEEACMHAETTALVAAVLQSLPDRQRDIVRGRFGFDTDDPWTLEQLGEQFGVSLERIRQIQGQALATLGKHPLAQSLAGREEHVSRSE
jgi:RNA polymerase primary sigma factor